MNANLPYILNGEFFEIIAQKGENVTVRCCFCDGGRNIYRGSIKSTGNFHMHIKRKHPSLLVKVRESKLRAFLARKKMQAEQKPKRKYFKYEIPEYPICALNLKTQPSLLNNNYTPVKHESSKDNKGQYVRNIYSTAFAQDLQQTQSSELHSTEFHPQNFLLTDCEQTEPTDLSYHKTHNEANESKNILSRIDSVLRTIESEMRVRNQIESNRLILELAKFKYINPDFNFRF